VKVVAPAFYAMNQPRIPMMASIGAVAGNLALNVVLHPIYGYKVLALGTSLAATLNFTILYSSFHRNIAPIPHRRVEALPYPTLRRVGKREDGERTHAARVSPTARQDRGEGLRAGKRAPLARRCLPVGLPRLTQLGLGSPVSVDARVPIPQRGEAPQVGCGRRHLCERLDGHELSHRRAGAVVERIRVRGVEVDEPRDPLGL
jgi:hypothetical protein